MAAVFGVNRKQVVQISSNMGPDIYRCNDMDFSKNKNERKVVPKNCDPFTHKGVQQQYGYEM